MRISLHPVNPQVRLVRHIVDVFQEGGIVIYPTDSGYSLGCYALHSEAIKRLYQLKKASKKYNMSLMVHNFATISHFAVVENSDYRYMKPLLPGPYTFILGSTNVGKKLLEVKRNEIGIRMPDHTFFKALHQINEKPLLCTSAKIHDDDFFTEPDEIEEHFRGKVDLFVDMGPTPINPTTVISLVSGVPEIVRKGAGKIPHEG